MKNRQSILNIYPAGQKFHRNRSISHGLGDTSNFKFLITIFVKNSKIQNGCHFWEKEKFLRIEQSILHIYPLDKKFRRNRSISHGLEVMKGFVFSSLIKTRLRTHLWPDAGCIHRQRPTNIG